MTLLPGGPATPMGEVAPARVEGEGEPPPMPRTWLWLQLLIGWLPVWALFATLIATVHGVPMRAAMGNSLRMMLTAAALGLVVRRLTMRHPWPHPFAPAFALVHLAAAPIFSLSWVALNSVVESVFRGQAVIVVGGAGAIPFLVTGVWLYAMVAGVSYTTQATERAARAEAAAARAQLAALRSQLNPHFLFNALHTIVHLIPREPGRAGKAAEHVAGLLRTAMEEERDLVSLGEEWAFVRRYLEVEAIRFGDRLRIDVELGDEARESLVPSFALQTLVENAVRHGAAPNVDATVVTVRARIAGGMLSLCVTDTGVGATAATLEASRGTGLRRLRERLAVLYGGTARLEAAGGGRGGFTASLGIPHQPADQS